MTSIMDNAQVIRINAGRVLSSRLGRFYIGLRDDTLVCGWQDGGDSLAIGTAPMPEWVAALAERLRSYLAGRRVDFSDVPLPAGPRFYRACWQACRAIPPGRVLSYGELAEAAGATKRAARSAGQAMRHNPLPILTPCHRVVGTGWLGGYSGRAAGDSPFVLRKKALLDLEAADLTGR